MPFLQRMSTSNKTETQKIVPFQAEGSWKCLSCVFHEWSVDQSFCLEYVTCGSSWISQGHCQFSSGLEGSSNNSALQRLRGAKVIGHLDPLVFLTSEEQHAEFLQLEVQGNNSLLKGAINSNVF